MKASGQARRPARTVLEQRIRELNQTQEEFAEYAMAFARDRHEPGTISSRHVQRLVSGASAGLPRPSTARLLERIFDLPIERLLSAPDEPENLAGGYPLRVAIAVVRKETDVLVVSPRADDRGDTAWQFPAGIVKPGIAPEVAAVRETLAETGVRCVVEKDLGSRVHPTTNVSCAYLLCSYVAGDARNVDTAENADVTWIPVRRLTQLVPAERIYPPILGALDLRAHG